MEEEGLNKLDPPGDSLRAMDLTPLRIAAIRSGYDPVRKLAGSSFPRTLEDQLICPKCDATYNLIVDWDQSANRWFAEDSRPHIRLLAKAIFMGHGANHRVTHFETAGVVVESVTLPQPEGTR